MTQQEFFKRTGVEVSDKEFAAISEVYVMSDVDKDEFCKMWRKMNATRVKTAKMKRDSERREDAARVLVWQFYKKTTSEDLYAPITAIKMNAAEVKAMAVVGITFSENGHSKRLLDIRYEIGKYMGIY